MNLTTRDRLITTASNLFYEQGFRNVGLDQILSKVGITKTAFYKHFESKEDLVSAVLDWHDRWWRDEFVKLLAVHGGNTPRDQIMALPKAFDTLFSCDSYNGCFFVNVVIDFPHHHDPAHIAAAAHKKNMEEILCQIAGYANASDPQAMAAELAMVMEGAYVTQQICPLAGSTKTLERLLTYICDRYLP